VAAPGQLKNHGSVGPRRPDARRRRAYLAQDRLAGRRVEDRIPGREQDPRPFLTQDTGFDQPACDARQASADVVAQSVDGPSRRHAVQMVPDRVVDVGQKLVAGPELTSPDYPASFHRQLPVDGQLDQQRSRQADLDDAGPGDNRRGYTPLLIDGHQQQHLGDQHNLHATVGSDHAAGRTPLATRATGGRPGSRPETLPEMTHRPRARS